MGNFSPSIPPCASHLIVGNLYYMNGHRFESYNPSITSLHKLWKSSNIKSYYVDEFHPQVSVILLDVVLIESHITSEWKNRPYAFCVLYRSQLGVVFQSLSQNGTNQHLMLHENPLPEYKVCAMCL